MTLGFKQQVDGRPTFFPEKIMEGLFDHGLVSISKAAELARNELIPFPESWKYIDTLRKAWGGHKPKLHTIREDSKGLWKPGRDIHMVVANRTPKRYQFAPLVPCISTQRVKIDFELPMQIIVDGSIISPAQVEILAVNDGFECADAFFDYFDTPNDLEGGYWCGKIIHWTDLKY